MARRRVTAHDLKRRLLLKLKNLPPQEVARIAIELREFALAKQFFDGQSFDSLMQDDSLGGVPWSRLRIERAVRNNPRAAA